MCVCVCGKICENIVTKLLLHLCTGAKQAEAGRAGGSLQLQARHQTHSSTRGGERSPQRSLLSSEVHDAVLQRSDTGGVCVCDALSLS